MKKQHFIISLFVIGFVLGFIGCSEKSSVTQTGQLTDEQSLKFAVTQIDSVAEFSASDEISIDDDGMKNPEFDGMVGMGMQRITLAKNTGDSIYPVRWGRHIMWNNIVRNYQVVIQGDTVANVLITKLVPGEFFVGWGTKSVDTVIIQDTVKKVFTETVQRKVIFKRIARTDNPRKNWVPIAVTMVLGKTNNVNNFSANSLEITSAIQHYDTTFVDPLAQWFRLGFFHGSIPKFHVGDTITVKLTLTSSDSLPEMVHLRHGIAGGWLERRRAKMQLDTTFGGSRNYTRVYTRTFRTGLPMGILGARFNIVTDILSNGTIYSRTAPFSNEFWGVPYIVFR